MVGTGRFELPTCRLGGGRSIHLSYVPIPDYILILNHFDIEPADPSASLGVAPESNP
jgi:hypothetical protein